MDDRTLVEKCKAGDEQAFAELVKRYSTRAYQVAYSVLGNCQDAEEVAQDAFVRIHKALPDFRGECEFGTWLYRIALNLARNKYRWNKVRGSQVNFSIDAPVEGDDGEDDRKYDLPDETPGPDKDAEMDELRGRLSAELAKLPEAYREILVMRVVQEMSYEEIADALGCQMGTVKSRLARARDELKKRLGDLQ